MGRSCWRVCHKAAWQLIILVRKNFVLQFRRPVGTLFELVLPAVATFLIIALRFLLNFSNEDRCFTTFDSDQLKIPSMTYSVNGRNNSKLFFTPQNSETEGIMEMLSRQLEAPYSSSFDIEPCETEEVMLRKLRLLYAEGPAFGCVGLGAGVVFGDFNGMEISYAIRLPHEVGPYYSWNTDRAAPENEFPGPRVTNYYLSEGFLHLQKLVGESVIEWEVMKAGKEYQSINIVVRQFPYPEYSIDYFLSSIVNFLPLLLVMAFIYSAGSFTKELVLEKETRMKEYMLMMGLSQWVLWVSWFIKQFIFFEVPVTLICILLRVFVFPKSDFFLLFIFFTLYIISSICFLFALSVLFSSARVALMIASVLWFINYLPFVIVYSQSTLALLPRLTTSLLSNTAFGFGVDVISHLEQRSSGLLWSNMAEPVSADDMLSVGWILGMFVLDSILYMTVAWYISGVWPGKYGVSKPFYFPFLLSYWCGTSRSISTKNEGENAEETSFEDSSAHEKVSGNLDVGISIKNLTKIYSQIFKSKSDRTKAVNNLNLDIYKGQITALLGHNGAGKTTTISILTGLYTPTEGTAMINGYSILTDMDLIRNSLGICPQYNVLFDRLTVREHLSFFMRLKGVYKKTTINDEVSKMIVDLQLADKGNTPVSTLSGGMKRKLSVGIALIGGSEVVILDEPTSGIDPYARRAIWDLLTKYKQNRCMLLTTHFMDEADVLGDRIAIMAEGKLRCSGSSLFLKSRYGVGYHMTVVKDTNCVSMEVERLVKSFVPTAKQATDVGAELSFILPSTEVAHFPELFDKIDAQKVGLGVASFGVSVTTMEEVFIKVVESTTDSHTKRFKNEPKTNELAIALPTNEYEMDEVISGSDLEVKECNEDGTIPEIVQTEEQLAYQFTPNTWVVLWLQQFWAIFVKKFYHSIRFYPGMILMLVIPAVFVILAFVTLVVVPGVRDDPPRHLSLGNSGLDSSNITVFYADLVGPPNFSKYSAQDLMVTDFFDISEPVQEIRNAVGSVGSINNISECCNYPYQILDKFCASRTANSLLQCGNLNESFGYSRCLNSCLACCSASNHQSSSLASCSHPSHQSPANNAQFCPSPPALSLFSDTSGPLDTHSTFINEYLLRKSTSSEVDTDVFFRRYQAGFTVTIQDPSLTVCGYGGNSSSSGGQKVLSPEACSDFELLSYCDDESFESCPTRMFQPSCRASGNEDDSICTSNETCVSVEPNSADLVQMCSCLDSTCEGRDETTANYTLSFLDRIVSKVYPGHLNTIEVTVWYNNGPLHMSAAALNAFQNLRLKETTGNSSLSLQVFNHPLPRRDFSRAGAVLSNPAGFGFSVIATFGYSFLLANFIYFIVSEKETKAKHLQFVSGVKISSYWLSNLAWDILSALIPVFVIAIIFILFAYTHVDAFTGNDLWAVVVILILTCWAGIPMTYLLSFLFKSPLAAVSVVVLFFLFGSLFSLTVVILVEGFNNERNAEILHYTFLFIPTYGLGSGLRGIYENWEIKTLCREMEMMATSKLSIASSIRNVMMESGWEGSTELAYQQLQHSAALQRYCKLYNLQYVDHPLAFEPPGIGVNCYFLFMFGCFYFLLTLGLEVQFFYPKIKKFIRGNGQNGTEELGSNSGEDTDVSAERRRVMDSSNTRDEVVVMKNLVKVYRAHLSGCSVRPPKTAVAGIYLGIPSGECFGLLGVNGAGKTTTFSILTGDIGMTSGTALIAGYNVKSDLGNVRQRLGYCPQFDALIEHMTGRELLVMFARLRGVPERHIGKVVEVEIGRLDLKKYADRKCKTYSGGNKRKLSTAIALVGNPPIILLDEPTTGMDPNTRRYLWDVLTNITREGRSIILTSHSMEECEALCTRLAIMVNGQFKCLGSIQHLKNKYGSGFTLKAKVDLSHKKVATVGTGATAATEQQQQSLGETATGYCATSFHDFVKENFQGAVAVEEHQGSVTYQLPSAGVTWSSVFRLLESNKERLGIVDYSVSQTTLEQVFLNFAKDQNEEV